MEEGLIDIHCHILPGLDDGPGDEQESIQMLEEARAQGISVLVATPHHEWRGPLTVAEGVRERIEALASRANAIGIEIKPGVEVMLAPGLLEGVRSGRLATIGGTGRYLLVELPFDSLPDGALGAIFELASGGITPIIAHPERNRQVQEDPNKLIEFISCGALVQVNAGSILGSFGKASQVTAEIALIQNMAHIIASDAHSSRGPRCFSLQEAVAAMARISGKRAAAMARDIPRLIIDGKVIPRPEPIPYEPPRKHTSSILNRLLSFAQRRPQGRRTLKA